MIFVKFFDKTVAVSLFVAVLTASLFSIICMDSRRIKNEKMGITLNQDTPEETRVGFFSIFHTINNKLSDTKFNIRGNRMGSDDVAFLDIDDKTIQLLDYYPLERKHYVTMIQALKESRMIFFDIFLTEESFQYFDKEEKKKLIEDVKQYSTNGKVDLQQAKKLIATVHPTYDHELARVSKEHGNVYWPAFVMDDPDNIINATASLFARSFMEEKGIKEEFMNNKPNAQLQVIRHLIETDYDTAYMRSFADNLRQIFKKNGPSILKHDIFKKLSTNIIGREFAGQIYATFKELAGEENTEAKIREILNQVDFYEIALEYYNENKQEYLLPDINRIEDNSEIHDALRWRYLKIKKHILDWKSPEYDNLSNRTDISFPILPLCEASKRLTYAMIEPDEDGAVRHYPLIVRYDRDNWNNALASIGLQLAGLYLDVPVDQMNIVPGSHVLIPNARVGPNMHKDIRIPVDENCCMIINWNGEWKAGFKNHVSFSKIITTDGKLKKNAPQLEMFKNKVVFIGYSGKGTTDMNPMPFEPRYPMVGSHANVFDTIIRERFITLASSQTNIALIIFLSLIVALGICKMTQMWAIMFITGLTIAYLCFDYYMFAAQGVFFNTFCGLGVILSCYGFVIFYRYMTEERAKKQTQKMFGTMVSPEVLDYMQDNPDSFSLGGTRMPATMFFSDVAGFTTISETLSADDLAKVLNLYLTPMSDIILDHGGYIDKYEGDAIMADFGVPLPSPSWGDDKTAHAWHCCWAAIEQQQRLDTVREEIQKEYGVVITVRMGINSGEVSAGNMGSSRKFQYTVMGDAVNQAARFEPANKDFGSMIMIGESTYELSKHKIDVRFLGTMIPKGKTVPIKVYELLGKKGGVSPEKMEAVKLFEDAWKLYAQKNWDQATKAFEAVVEKHPDDEPSKKYISRIKNYKELDLPEDWKGEFIQVNK